VTRRWVGRQTDRRSPWMRQRLERRGTNRTAVAVVNKHARIVWALLTSHQADQPVQGATDEAERGPRVGSVRPRGGLRG
jgi:hypothetical protein